MLIYNGSTDDYYYLDKKGSVDAEFGPLQFQWNGSDATVNTFFDSDSGLWGAIATYDVIKGKGDNGYPGEIEWQVSSIEGPGNWHEDAPHMGSALIQLLPSPFGSKPFRWPPARVKSYGRPR